MYTVEEIVANYGDTISKLGYGRSQLMNWLNDNVEGEYSQYFARKVLEKVEMADEGGFRGYRTMEELLREIYGLHDPTWVPVSIWGDPNKPLAKWQRHLQMFDKEKIDELNAQIQKAGISDVARLPERETLAVLSIRDAHFGMFTDYPEPYETYDLEETQRHYLAAAFELMNRAKDHKVEHLVYIVGSDMISVDGPANTTTKGTPQDVTTTWRNAFKAALESSNAVIAEARKMFKSVTVVCEPGNHDNTLAQALGLSLHSKWGEEINVLAEGDSIKMVNLGNAYIFMHHGDNIKPEDYQGVIYDRYPECAKSNRYVEILTGHLHHRRRNILRSGGDYLEEKSIVHRITPALCPSSNWTESMGYSSEPGAQLTIYNSDGFEALFEYRPRG